jgi:hypothetical protein
MQLWKYDTVRSLKSQLCRAISCQSDWTPQQVHYSLRLYNQHYQELPDGDTLVALERGGVIWNEDDIYMILRVDSGRVVDAIERAMRYLRSVCIGLRPMAVREEPNHNYMFAWCSPPARYSPPPELVTPDTAATSVPGQTMSQLLSDPAEAPALASSYLDDNVDPYMPLLSAGQRNGQN